MVVVGIAEGENAAARGVGFEDFHATEGGEGPEVPCIPCGEGRMQAHAGAVVRVRDERIDDPREEARSTRPRRSPAPRSAHGAEADEVAGVVDNHARPQDCLSVRVPSSS